MQIRGKGQVLMHEQSHGHSQGKNLGRLHGFDLHHHTDCIATGLKNAESHCAAHGLQLTPTRRRVLEILLTQNKSLGAYELLDHLRDEGLGSQPPVIYRALDFLLTHGFIHRIESRNAYVACTVPDCQNASYFLVCRSCNAVAEAADWQVEQPLQDTARQAGFEIERFAIEAEGVCPACQEPPA